MAQEEVTARAVSGNGFSQPPLTWGEITQSWWKHGATLEKIQLKKMFHVDEADAFGSSLDSVFSFKLTLINFLNGRDRSQI